MAFNAAPRITCLLLSDLDSGEALRAGRPRGACAFVIDMANDHHTPALVRLMAGFALMMVLNTTLG